MRDGDVQLGIPYQEYTTTKTIVEALTGISNGSIAYASDTLGLGLKNTAGWSWITNPTASTLALNISATKTITLTATDNSSIIFTGASNLTIPTAGNVVAALLGTANVFIANQQINGNLQIGSPTYLSPTIKFYSSTDVLLINEGGTVGWATQIYMDGIGGGGTIIFQRAGGTIASPSATLLGMSLGSFSFRGYDGSAFTGSKGFLSFLASENWSATANGTYAQIRTTKSTTTTLVTRFNIADDGSVTVGSAVNKNSLFNVIGSEDRIQLLVIGHSTNAVSTPIIQFTRNDTAAGVSAMLGLTALGSGANGDGGKITLAGKSSTTAATAMGQIDYQWVNATHASRTSRITISAYDSAIREGIRIEASGTAPMVAFFGGTSAVQQVLAAYTSDGEGAAYTGIDNAQAGTPYAQLTDLNQLRVAYETLRASYDDLRTKLQTSTIVG